MGTVTSASFVRKNLISRQFGEVLRQYRLSRGWSQSVLSTKSKVDRTYISQIERGLKNLSLYNVHRLADALRISPADFFVAGGSKRTVR